VETFQVIRRVVDQNIFHSIVFLGDINCDFRRNTPFVRNVRSFLQELHLQQAWEKFEIDFTHFQETNEISHVSVIDHFFWSGEIEQNVREAGVIHHPENMSDHAPIYCSIDLETIPVDASTPDYSSQIEKPSWKLATKEQKQNFPSVLERNLLEISTPEEVQNCRDVKCRNTDHSEKADEFVRSLLECVEKSAAEALPTPKPKSESPTKSKQVPGWTNSVKPFRDKAYFWYQVWISAGRPLNTELHRIMKKTKNIYHFQYRKCKKSEDIIIKSKLLDACINGNGDIFAEIKKLRKCKPTIATSMDGEKDDIPGHFKNIFKDIYNSANDQDELNEVMVEVENKINEASLADVDLVTPEIVEEATKHLNESKSDPYLNFSSDCIKHGTKELFQKLAVVIKSFLIHGHVTYFLLLATLVPIIKDKLGSLNSSKNYRTVAISSLILKLMDWILLILYGSKLGIDDLQFAYQPGVSANMCTWTVIETVNYFIRNGGNVYCCLMDMTKAFDLVKHSMLFRKFLNGGLSVIFIRLLIFIYINQFANIRWNSCFSSTFSMTNGVRQGAILSGFAYCFYMNNLFTKLRKNKSGCWVRGTFLGILGYSDDSLLLAPSLDTLQEMLKVCEEYADEHNLRFSTDKNPEKCKTKCIAFLIKDRPLPPLKLSGNSLPWVKSGKHLGITIGDKIDGMKTDLKIKRADYISKNNDILQEFGFSHPKTKIKINSIYNSHLSGSCLWDLFSKEAVQLENTWNVSMRLMMDLPRETHRRLIEPLSGVKHVKFLMLKRFLTFIEQIRKSSKKASNSLLESILHDTRSITGSNLRNILLMTDKLNVRDLGPYDIDKMEYHPLPDEEKWKISIIQEIIDEKNGRLKIDNLTEEELETTLEHLCVS
jgi:hypothetical protein